MSVEEKTKFYGTGRRKTSVARVYLSPGSGEITINGAMPQAYFQRTNLVTNIKEPLALTGTEAKFNVWAKVFGGGVSGQAEAVRLGISRALLMSDTTLKGILKKNGLLTRDARIKERKKYGQRGARAKFQFSKR